MNMALQRHEAMFTGFPGADGGKDKWPPWWGVSRQMRKVRVLLENDQRLWAGVIDRDGV